MKTAPYGMGKVFQKIDDGSVVLMPNFIYSSKYSKRQLPTKRSGNLSMWSTKILLITMGLSTTFSRAAYVNQHHFQPIFMSIFPGLWTKKSRERHRMKSILVSPSYGRYFSALLK
jgi:hypothetical protein